MALVKVLTITKPGVVEVDIFGATANQAVPVGSQFVFKSVGSVSAPYDLEVIYDYINGFAGIKYIKFPAGQNPEDYFIITEVEQNPDGSFNPSDEWKLPKWLYTNGVIDKLGPGVIDPEWWKKNKWWIWAIGGLVALIMLDNDKK